MDILDEKLKEAGYHEVRLVVHQHVNEKIDPLREKIMKLEMKGDIHHEKLVSMEKRLDECFTENTSQWKKLDEKLDKLSEQLGRVLWVSAGVAGTISIFWIFGKEIANILLKIFGA